MICITSSLGLVNIFAACSQYYWCNTYMHMCDDFFGSWLLCHVYIRRCVQFNKFIGLLLNSTPCRCRDWVCMYMYINGSIVFIVIARLNVVMTVPWTASGWFAWNALYKVVSRRVDDACMKTLNVLWFLTIVAIVCSNDRCVSWMCCCWEQIAVSNSAGQILWTYCGCKVSGWKLWHHSFSVLIH
jgi:hypothetical protein